MSIVAKVIGGLVTYLVVSSAYEITKNVANEFRNNPDWNKVVIDVEGAVR